MLPFKCCLPNLGEISNCLFYPSYSLSAAGMEVLTSLITCKCLSDFDIQYKLNLGILLSFRILLFLILPADFLLCHLPRAHCKALSTKQIKDCGVPDTR